MAAGFTSLREDGPLATSVLGLFAISVKEGQGGRRPPWPAIPPHRTPMRARDSVPAAPMMRAPAKDDRWDDAATTPRTDRRRPGGGGRARGGGTHGARPRGPPTRPGRPPPAPAP